jgi:hypothetical protein
MPRPAAVIIFAFAALAVLSAPLRAGNATEGIVVFGPADGVTVVTVSTDVAAGSETEEAPAVNVLNEITVVTIVPRRFRHSRCSIGVPYPWQRRFCGDPLYPF